VGAGGRNDPALYAHMNNKKIKITKKIYKGRQIYYFLLIMRIPAPLYLEKWL
jgi:hypothetical protein